MWEHGGNLFFVTLRAFSWSPHFQESDGCALWEKKPSRKAFDILWHVGCRSCRVLEGAWSCFFFSPLCASAKGLWHDDVKLRPSTNCWVSARIWRSGRSFHRPWRSSRPSIALATSSITSPCMCKSYLVMAWKKWNANQSKSCWTHRIWICCSLKQLRLVTTWLATDHHGNHQDLQISHQVQPWDVRGQEGGRRGVGCRLMCRSSWTRTMSSDVVGQCRTWFTEDSYLDMSRWTTWPDKVTNV